MKKVLITGGRGFLGRNLAAHLSERQDCATRIVDQNDPIELFAELLLDSDLVFHLAGVNRPQNPGEFETGNAGLTERICQILRDRGRVPKIVFSSSIQAELDTPYGVSKSRAEIALRQFAADTGACVRIYRLKNLFGKWCRPDYNSVTATFCHNIANDLPIAISDPRREIELSCVDDVIAAFCQELDGTFPEAKAADIPSYRIALGDLAGRIQSFHEMKSTLALPDFGDEFNRALYATYLSYLPADAREYGLTRRADGRGSLAEFLKQDHFGEIFVSRTKPGITRGNHYHHIRAEKFLVVEGEGLIRMRSIEGGPVAEYPVKGADYRVVDIPPGFTHSIKNVGEAEMVTLFWSSEIFDPDRPDTYYLPVGFEEITSPVLLERA